MLDDLPDPRRQQTEGSDASSVDRTKEFAKLSQKKPADVDAERAFLKSKIELARRDPGLSDSEKARFISELQQRLDSLGENDNPT
jgi:hypothetical protein